MHDADEDESLRWATLTLLIVLMTAAAVWCGRDGADWQEATSATGDYVIEFPGQPSTERQIPDSDLSTQLTDLEADSGYYALAETALNGITPNPLDVVVDSSIENARAKMESRHSSPVAAREISRTTGDFEGVETRKFRVKLVGRGGVDWTALNGLLFYRDDVIVSAIVVTDADIDVVGGTLPVLPQEQAGAGPPRATPAHPRNRRSGRRCPRCPTRCGRSRR
jgi:hypothetical protein